MCERIATAPTAFGFRAGRQLVWLAEKAAASLMKDKSNRIKDICRTLGVSRATLYRYVTPTGEIRPVQGRAVQ